MLDKDEELLIENSAKIVAALEKIADELQRRNNLLESVIHPTTENFKHPHTFY